MTERWVWLLEQQTRSGSGETLTFAAHHVVEGLLPFLHLGRSRLPKTQ